MSYWSLCFSHTSIKNKPYWNKLFPIISCLVTKLFAYSFKSSYRLWTHHERMYSALKYTQIYLLELEIRENCYLKSSTNSSTWKVTFSKLSNCFYLLLKEKCVKEILVNCNIILKLSNRIFCMYRYVILLLYLISCSLL